MAHIYRLIFTAFVMLCAWLPITSFADTASTEVFYAQWSGQSQTQGPTALGQCQSLYSQRLAAGNGALSGTVTASVLSCYAGATLFGYINHYYWCPVNGQVSTVDGRCPDPLPVTTPESVCKDLNIGDQKITYPATNTSTSKSSIYKGVTVTGKTIIYGKLNGAVVPGSQVVYGPFTCAAGSTTSADVPAGGDAAPGPASCKTTEYYGTVNGIPTCVSGALSSTNVVQSIAPTPAGSASNPASGLGPKAPPGAVSSGTETTCQGSTCKTTTTYKDATGATVGTSEDTQDQPSFCEENPALSICKDSRFSLSNCTAPPSCDGDAVQCGIAKLSWQSACALNPTPGAETTLYDSSKGLTGNQTQGAAGAPVNLGVGSFSTTDLIGGGGSGMSDLSITVWNTPITLPLSNLNQYLAMFGNVLMAVAFIVAVSIVRGR